jgi:hypothetical protein
MCTRSRSRRNKPQILINFAAEVEDEQVFLGRRG